MKALILNACICVPHATMQLENMGMRYSIVIFFSCLYHIHMHVHTQTHVPTHTRTCTCKNHPLNVIIFLFLPYQIECTLLFRTDIWYNFSHLKFVLDSLSLDQRLWFCFESGTWFNGQICASVLGLLSGNGSEVTNICSHVKNL